MSEIHTTTSAEETRAVASKIAGNLHRGDIVALFGDFGSGKTQFVKGVCDKFKVQTSAASPSFVILNRYEGKDEAGRELLLYHFDFYRIKSTTELYDLGFEEFMHSEAICLIEWAEALGSLLPQRRYEIRLSYGAEENERIIAVTGVGIR